MKELSTPDATKNPGPSQYPETAGSMKQLLILLWVFWANMLWVFGIPSFYFLFLHHFSRWAFVSVPVFLFTLFAGWRLFLRSRKEWRQNG